MAKSKGRSSFWSELLKFNLYKRNQGRLTRQLTWVGIALIVFFGTWTLSQGPLAEVDRPVRLGVSLGLAAAGAWIIFRAVNYPRFADFLISVEAEMDKVSWASREELIRATVVVLGTMFFLGLMLLVFDQFWVYLFTKIGFLRL